MSNGIRHAQGRKRAFGLEFWLTYMANFSMMITVSTMFRYSDFVTVLGGTEFHLGWIVGIGMSGAVVFRLVQGVCIDRYGAGRVWMFSVICVTLSLLAHFLIQRLDTPTVFLARMLYATSVSGFFGASITFVSLRAPAGRMAEMIGVLGSSGFLGMALGPMIADWLFIDELSRGQVDKMFWAAIATAIVSMVACWFAISRRPRPTPQPQRRRPPVWWLLKRYNPGRILLASFMLGLGISIPFTFARPFAAEISVDGIRSFFFVYAATAFSLRIATKNLPDRWGVRPTLMLGLGLLCLSMIAYIFAHDAWSFLLPAFLGGASHAFSFPAAMAGGSLAFPHRYRGLATNLLLAFFDFGGLVGQPVVGSILHIARELGWPAYPVTFVCAALFMIAAGIAYAIEPARAQRGSLRKTTNEQTTLEALSTS